MGFLDLQNMIVQSRKAKKGVKNRTDYFGEDFAKEKAYKAIYRKALDAANKVVDHYFEVGEIEKFSIVWGKPQKEKKEKSIDDKKYREMKKKLTDCEQKCEDLAKFSYDLTNKNLELAEKIVKLEHDLERTRRGGRHKDWRREQEILNYKKSWPDASIREIAAALKASTRTVQSVLSKNGYRGRRK